MRNFQDTFETRKRSFIIAFPTCVIVPLLLPIIGTASSVPLEFHRNFMGVL